jgi:hypothetical protein
MTGIALGTSRFSSLTSSGAGSPELPCVRRWSAAIRFPLRTPGMAADNPPGVAEVPWATPGTLVALAATYAYGARLDKRQGIERPHIT